MAKKDKHKHKIVANAKSKPSHKHIENDQQNTSKKSQPASNPKNQFIEKSDLVKSKSGIAHWVLEKLKKTLNISFFIITLFSTLSGVALKDLFIPSLELDTNTSLNSMMPYENIFQLKNTSKLTISNIDMYTIIDTLTNSSGNEIIDASFQLPFGKDIKIRPNQFISFFSPVFKYVNFIPYKHTRGTVAFLVKYRYLFLNWQDVTYYKVIQDRSEQYIWIKDYQSTWLEKSTHYHELTFLDRIKL